MKNFNCPHCGCSIEAIIPPNRCLFCGKLIVSPKEAAIAEEYHLAPMKFVKETKISNFWYCKSCQMYRKNNSYENPPPCPACSSTDYHYNRESIFVVGVESYLEDALRQIETASPDLNEIRNNLRVCYGW